MTEPRHTRFTPMSKLIETQKPEKHFFFRAESFFNHAAELDRQAQLELRKYSRIYAYKAYGGRSLLEQSHGESFLCAFLNYASRNTLFILDEPEAALSPQRQLALLVRIHELVNNGCQLIISTHSPILMAYPNADIHAYGANDERTAWVILFLPSIQDLGNVNDMRITVLLIIPTRENGRI